jgi:tRNA-specific 2-thiouridylase
MMFFTIGQNKGIGLGGQHEKYFVCKKNIKKNILYVCNEKNKEKYLSSTKCIVKKIN